jgi:MFS family permease
MANNTDSLPLAARLAGMLQAPRELWIVYLLKLVAVAGYGVLNSTLVLWLSADFGWSDERAAAVVLAWSLSMTVGTVLVGSLTDALGLKRTFFIGVVLCVLARATMVFAETPVIAIGAGLVPLALGEAMATPVLVAAVRRYSSTSQRSFAFSLFYAMMNVGFLVAGFSFDWVREGLGEAGRLSLPLFEAEIGTYRALLLLSLGIEVLLLPLVWFLREGVEATDEGVVVAPAQPAAAQATSGGPLGSAWAVVRKSAHDTATLFSSLVRQDGFWRLIAFLLMIAFLKLIFMQMYYVYPKFGIRELGPGAPVGRLWAINSILIIALVPVVGLLTSKYSAYRMVVVGGIVSAASVFVMALPVEWFQGLADGWFGRFVAHSYLGLEGPVHPYYPMIALFVVGLSIGEALYSPRVYEYAAAIAPKGQETSYAALSYIPFLLAKLLIGAFSGLLLSRYCPAEGPRDSGTMWLFVALTASIAPVGLLLLARRIRVKDAGRAD